MKVAIIMGSDSDLKIMKETKDTLEYFGVDVRIDICSAHRAPELLKKIVGEIEKECDVIIAGAGMAAHLPGVIASLTYLPVIGVPLAGSSLNGVDALYSIVQMPKGIPVATVAVGKAGAVNAGVLALEMLSIKYDELKEKLKKYKRDLEQAVVEKNKKLNEFGIEKYISNMEK